MFLDNPWWLIHRRETKRNCANPIEHGALLKPKRITITVPQTVYDRLGEISFRQGRSMSNLASFLLERSIEG
jgi:hypothetical protein